MKLKHLILSGIAAGSLAFTCGIAQPVHAAIGMETPAPAQNLEKPATVTTQHHINVDGKVLEPVNNKVNVIYVDGQPLVALRQVSEALGYTVSWDAPTKTALIDMNIATLAVQPGSKQIVRKGKLQIINLDTSESLLPAARMEDGILYVSPQAFKLLLNDVNITKDEIFIAPQRSQLASETTSQKVQQNGVETFLPPAEDKTEPLEESTSEKKPIVTVKRSTAESDSTKETSDSTKDSENQRANGLDR